MLNWTNVQYANGSGILNSMAANDKAAAEGRQQIVDSFAEFGEVKKKSETDSFINNMMQYKDNPDKVQELISGANTDWLDLERINTARTEVNKPSDDLAMFQNKADYTFEYDKKLATLKNEETAKALAIKNAAKNKGVNQQDFIKELTKNDSAAGETPWWGVLGGVDTPAEEVQDRLTKYFADHTEFTKKDRDKVRGIFVKDTSFDTNQIDEFWIPGVNEIEDTNNTDIDNFLRGSKFKSEAERARDKIDDSTSAEAIEKAKKKLKAK